MKELTLNDLRLGLEDLHGPRKKTLESSASGRLYTPLLRQRHELFRSVTAAETRRPLADELAAHDLLHDAYGAAAFTVLDAYRRFLDLPVENDLNETARVAKKLQGIFIP